LQGARVAKFFLRRLCPCKVQGFQNFACVGHDLARCKPCIWAILEMYPGVLFYPESFVTFVEPRRYVKEFIRKIEEILMFLFLIKFQNTNKKKTLIYETLIVEINAIML
jgi:hypothetical protein